MGKIFFILAASAAETNLFILAASAAETNLP
jgi:hypothetical protein